MKTFLLLTWLLIGGAGYYGYNFYQQSLADAQKAARALNEANESNADLNSQMTDLTQQVATLQAQLAEVKKEALALSPPSVAPLPTASPPTTSIPTSIPTTITTILGKTYTGCVLSRVTPDGISFTHSMGVAKVLFSDLDPAFASTFGYDPAAARKYEQDQAAQEAQSDAMRNAAQAAPAPIEIGAAPAVASANQGAAQKTAIQSQIASMQSQITSLQSEAQSLEAQQAAQFNSYPNIYYNSTGQVEHHYTMGHSQQADADRAQIQSLQAKIVALQASL